VRYLVVGCSLVETSHGVEGYGANYYKISCGRQVKEAFCPIPFSFNIFAHYPSQFFC
jgi:hypothetical protein